LPESASDRMRSSRRWAPAVRPPDPTGVLRIHPVVVTPDGRTWAYTATQVLSELYVYAGLQ